MNLTQRDEYFKNRKGEKSFFTPADTLLVFIASELSDFFPFRNVSEVVRELSKYYPHLYRLLKQNPKQFLAVDETLDLEKEKKFGIESYHYVTYPLLIDELKVLDWENHKKMVLVNLEKIYTRIEKLFETEGIIIHTGDIVDS